MSWFTDAIGYANPLTLPFAVTNSVGGDKGRQVMSELPLVGGLASTVFGNPAEEAVQEQFKRTAEAARQARSQAAVARPLSLRNALEAFGPANQMLQQMYGPQFGFDFDTISKAASGMSLGGVPAGQPTPQAPQAPQATQGPAATFAPPTMGNAGGVYRPPGYSFPGRR